MNDFLSNRQMAALLTALTALTAVVVGGLVILTDQLFQARLERASAVHMVTDSPVRGGSPSRPLE